MLSALTASLEGRFEDDERATARSEAISMALGDSGARFTTDVHRALSAWVQTAPIDPKLRARIASYVPGRAAIAAWFAAQDGDRAATRAALDQLGGHVPSDPDLAAMAASAVAFAGDLDFVQATYALLASRQNRIVLASMVGGVVLDLCDRLLLTLATAAEQWDPIDRHAEQGLTIARRLGSPVWAARVQADWADALEKRRRSGDLERAADLRQQALEAAKRLNMPGLIARCTPAASSAAAHPGAASHPSVPAARAPNESVTLSRQGGLWQVSGFGEAVHVKDSRGVQMIAQLVAEPHRALHALDLAGSGEAADGGDAGAALDQQARMQYRARLSELAQARDEAEARADRGQIERVNQEIEALSAEIERAFGLGGRERRVGSASERARSNVQRRIAHGIEQIRGASPRLGEHLAATLRTGTYCLYRPR
jgi:hypothetical protein